MQRSTSRSTAFAALVMLSLGASTLLTGCWEKDQDSNPSGSVCNTAATVVDLSSTTGCGLALQLADGTYLIPTGSNWTDFHATAGQKLLVGYAKKGSCGSSSSQSTCPAGTAVVLGCISLDTSTTTTTTTTGTGSN